MVGHEACDELPFVQYAGFSCMLPTPGIVPCDDHASVGVTIAMRTRPGCSSARRISANVLTRRKGRLHWRLEARRLCAWTSSTLPPGMNGLSYRCWKPYTVVFMNRRVRSALPLGLYATLQSPLIETRGWRTNTCTRGLSFDHHSPGDEIIEGKPYMYRRLGSSSWTNGMASAVPMLASAWRLGDDAMRRHALDGIEHTSNIASTRRTDCPTRRWNMSGGATALVVRRTVQSRTHGYLVGQRCTRRCGRGRSNGGSAESITRTG